MATRTYHCGSGGQVHRLTNLTGAWVNVSVYLGFAGYNGNLFDIKTDPNDSDKVFTVGTADFALSGFLGIGVSANAGATWVAPTGTYSVVKQWNEVWPIDSNNIVAIGAGGACAMSADGGLTFDLVPSYATPSGTATTGQGYAIHFISPTVGIASFEGFVLLTTNAGALWTVLNGGTALNVSGGPVTVNAVYISNNQQLIVVNSNRVVFTSTNAGASFTITHTWANREGIHMTWLPRYNATKYWATGQGDARISTLNPTGAWTVLNPTIITLNPKDFAAHFYTNNNGFFSRTGELRVSSDGGVTGSVTDAYPAGAIFAVWTTSTPCFRLIDCQGNEPSIVTNTDLSANIGDFITIEGSDICWNVGANDNCVGAIPVVVVDTFDSCEACVPKCYLLTDCDDILPAITTDTDLSIYVGKTIKINGKSTCWTVSITSECDCVEAVETVDSYFHTCEECQAPPPLVPTIPYIEPGFSTQNCNDQDTIKANVNFANALYKDMMQKRFSVSLCCDVDMDEAFIRLTMIDLGQLYDPAFCPEQPSCGCLPCIQAAEPCKK